MKNYLVALSLPRMMLSFSLLLVVSFVIVFSASCQSQSPPSVPPAPNQTLPEEPTPGTSPAPLPTVEVMLDGFTYKPAEITITAGTTVVWRNRDSVIHTVTARGRSFDSGSLSRGDTFSYTFKQKGVFEYYCIPHPYMEGKVTVE